MKNTLVTVIIVIILVLGGFFLFKNKGVAPTKGELNDNIILPGIDAKEDQGTKEIPVTSPNNIKEFSIDAAPYSFTPSTMTVNKGDTVKITLRNVKGSHNLKIDEFNVATSVLKAGETQTISFVADKIGTFEYYCSVGNHRAMGMVGNLIVR